MNLNLMGKSDVLLVYYMETRSVTNFPTFYFNVTSHLKVRRTFVLTISTFFKQKEGGNLAWALELVTRTADIESQNTSDKQTCASFQVIYNVILNMLSHK